MPRQRFHDKSFLWSTASLVSTLPPVPRSSSQRLHKQDSVHSRARLRDLWVAETADSLLPCQKICAGRIAKYRLPRLWLLRLPLAVISDPCSKAISLSRSIDPSLTLPSACTPYGAVNMALSSYCTCGYAPDSIAAVRWAAAGRMSQKPGLAPSSVDECFCVPAAQFMKLADALNAVDSKVPVPQAKSAMRREATASGFDQSPALSRVSSLTAKPTKSAAEAGVV